MTVNTDRGQHRVREATEEYYRRVKGLEAAAAVFEGTGEPEDIVNWAKHFEYYLETGHERHVQ